MLWETVLCKVPSEIDEKEVCLRQFIVMFHIGFSDIVVVPALSVALPSTSQYEKKDTGYPRDGGK